jgi:electron-transferring-flavoprotein dehydrogenase
MEREHIDYDVVIVGAGPSGLSAACRLKQIKPETSVVIVEKGSEVGAHILSGAVLEPTALNELFPDWRNTDAPVNTAVSEDKLYFFTETRAIKIPHFFAPKTMRNNGNFVISLGNLCRWLAKQAEQLGVDIFPGFSASSLLYSKDGSVAGIITGDMGIDAKNKKKSSYTQGMEIRGKYTLLSEGCRGHLGKEVIEKFSLDNGCDPQHYAIGIKELWSIPNNLHKPGLVIHSAGWPLSESNSNGGGFLYHTDDCQVMVGLITDLSYSNPHLNPYEEFQRYKHHPEISKYLLEGKRISYGAKALAKGGIQSQPKMDFPGGILIGDNAGTLNNAKIKGIHCAMKSGMVAAESITKFIGSDVVDIKTDSFSAAYKKSSAYKELVLQRNFGPAQHKWGNILGSAFAFLDINIFNGKLPWTLRAREPDHIKLKPAETTKPITYNKPDNKISFDKLSSVYLSNTNHEEDQPSHLILKDQDLPLSYNLPVFSEPAQRYCPAGVYEILTNDDGSKKFQINSQNCVHCKTCDIKEPSQNINWVTPEGGGGPNYPNM